MRAEAMAAVKVSIFGIVLIGLCFLLLRLLGTAFSLDPVVLLAAMAGVLIPMVMVTVGMLTCWTLDNPGIVREPSALPNDLALSSLAAGLTTAIGSAVWCTLTLIAPPDGPGGLLIYMGNLDAYGYLEVATLLVAYVALSAIGGILYDAIMPGMNAFRD